MRDPILELTRSQLELITASANSLRPEWRERYRLSVCDELLRYDRRISDDEVAQAADSVRRAFIEGIDDLDDCY